MKRILLVFYLLIAPFIHINGQERNDRIHRIIDSLETYKPKRITSYKTKGNSFQITVRTQREFDAINERITSAINNGAKTININIVRGWYFFKEKHINRINEDRPDVSINIVGKDAIIIAAGKEYKNGDDYIGDFNPITTFVDVNNELKTYSCWSDIHFADSLIQVIDVKEKLCRLPFKGIDDFDSDYCKDAYISLTQWYESITYRVKQVKDGWIYFYADNLKYSSEFPRKDYNVNYDYIYGEQNPRFRLCNISVKGVKLDVDICRRKFLSDTEILHECRASNFLNLYHVRYKSFSVSGLHFVGNKGGGDLIGLSGIDSEVFCISECRFEAINNAIVVMFNSKNCLFKDNIVRGSYTSGIIVKNGCENVQIINNRFEQCCWIMAFSFCAVCECKDFYIANNTFKDFSYGAILAGLMRGADKEYECSGIIESNEIFLTDQYFNNKEKYTIMDAGAIQLRTQSDYTIVRYNYIHDYTGMRSNRGIFCDEGAYNFSIYGNVILNTPNCYSIDSRRVNDMNENDSLNNTSNTIMYNIVDNYIRFAGRQDPNNNCSKGANVFFSKKGTVLPACQYGLLEWNDDDISLEYKGVRKGRIIVSRPVLKQLKELPTYKEIRVRFTK